MYHKKIISLKIFAKNVNAPRVWALQSLIANRSKTVQDILIIFFPEKYSLSPTCWVTFEFLSNNPSL